MDGRTLCWNDIVTGQSLGWQGQEHREQVPGRQHPSAMSPGSRGRKATEGVTMTRTLTLQPTMRATVRKELTMTKTVKRQLNPDWTSRPG